ncbi:MAG: AMP-binding protein, partial [Firmicutes bacterium]|nr:AMP-binding protein [Bacillota bacterium]
MMSDWLSYRAQISPDKLAVSYQDVPLTFAQMDHQAALIAAVLQQYGITAQDRVALLSCATPQWMILAHAVLRIGAILVPLNTRLTPDEWRPLLNDCRPSAILVDALHDDAINAVQTSCPVLAIDEIFAHSRHMSPLPAAVLSDRQIAAIVYTSGTTGPSKGAVISRGNLYASAVASGIYLGSMPDDLWLHAMPLFHVGGLSIIFRSVILGSGVILQQRFDANTVNHTLETRPVTLLSVVP